MIAPRLPRRENAELKSRRPARLISHIRPSGVKKITRRAKFAMKELACEVEREIANRSEFCQIPKQGEHDAHKNRHPLDRRSQRSGLADAASSLSSSRGSGEDRI